MRTVDGKKIEILQSAYHRNGVSAEGFWIIRFSWDDRIMLANIFDDSGQISIVDANLAASGEIGFGRNSWRGDNFANALPTVADLSRISGEVQDSGHGYIATETGMVEFVKRLNELEPR
jgi:hypothetical protein